MGFLRRVFFEKARRSTVGAGKDFEATANDRLELSYAEAKRFEHLLRSFDSQCSSHLRAIRAFDDATQHFMANALPRMHTVCEDGKVYPVGEPRSIGGHVDTHTMAARQEESRTQIKTEVTQPIRMWLGSFAAVTLSMKEVRKQRLALDSRRREIQVLQEKLTRERRRLGEGATISAKITKFEEDIHRKEAKMVEAVSTYTQKEASTYANMEVLVNDAKFVQAQLKHMFEVLSAIGITEAELLTPATQSLTPNLQGASSGVVARYAPLETAVSGGMTGHLAGLTESSLTQAPRNGGTAPMAPLNTTAEQIVHAPTILPVQHEHAYEGKPEMIGKQQHVNVYMPEDQQPVQAAA